ncbi:MAG: toll/interleukin-1 receptor domain-containing protein [Cyanobium sp.]
MKRDVFLSHTSSDKLRYVRPLSRKLEERGITYWLDEAEISWGERVSMAISRGLEASRYVLVVLSEEFLRRTWPQTELSAAIMRENAEGRTVVLPLVIGDPASVLKEYPLLRDKAYLLWDAQNTSTIADRLLDLIKPQQKVKMVRVRVAKTQHYVACDLIRLLRFLRSLYWHNVYDCCHIRDELALCGLLAEVLPGEIGVVVNGVEVRTMEPTVWGEPGVPAVDLTREIFLLCSGGVAPKTATYVGLGPNYRAMVSELAGLFGVDLAYEFD